jgi:hypothetical protein
MAVDTGVIGEMKKPAPAVVQKILWYLEVS